MIGFKRGKSLKDLLITTKTPSFESIKSSGWLRKKCNVSPFINSTDKFAGKYEERKYIIKSEMNCSSSNVIYLNT